MPAYKMAAQFTAAKIGKTGITVTVDVFRLGTVGAVATDQSATELGLGVYVYTHTDATAGDYFGVFKTADATVDLQQVPSWSAKEYPIVETNLDQAISTLALRIAALVASPADGASLTITNGVSFAATLSSLTIPATWSKVYLTAKSTQYHADADSVLQLMVTNPAASANDGIIVLNGAAGGTSRTLGSLTVNQSAGTVAIVVQDNIDLSALVGLYEYDVKCLLADGTSQLLAAADDLTIALTPTRAIA